MGPEHTSTLNTVTNLAILYSDPGKLKEEVMYERTLHGGSISHDETSSLHRTDHWTTFSETMSLSSRTDFSLMSGVQLPEVALLVDSLFHDQELKSLCVIANARATSNEFQSQLCRLFRQYGKDLLKDAVGQSKELVAELFTDVPDGLPNKLHWL